MILKDTEVRMAKLAAAAFFRLRPRRSFSPEDPDHGERPWAGCSCPTIKLRVAACDRSFAPRSLYLLPVRIRCRPQAVGELLKIRTMARDRGPAALSDE
jgi:hypothetical protein